MKILHQYLHNLSIECNIGAGNADTVYRVLNPKFLQLQTPLRLRLPPEVVAIEFDLEWYSELLARVGKREIPGVLVRGTLVTAVCRQESWVWKGL